jgi:hypothetical protein
VDAWNIGSGLGIQLKCLLELIICMVESKMETENDGGPPYPMWESIMGLK